MASSSSVLKLSYRSLRCWAFSFLLLPVLIFLISFVKWMIAVPAAALLVWVFTRAIREETDPLQTIQIPKRRLLLFGAICCVWCFLGGQGGLFFQTGDWNERNAILRDLVTRPWPVYYPETDTMLSYYIGHWMPPALIGRALYLMTGQSALSFTVANLSLGLWTAFGVSITLLLHLCTVRSSRTKGQWTVLLLFIFFSGLDFPGCFLKGWSLSDFLTIEHLEWWVGSYQFSSNTTCLFWVFNQAIPAWVATLCFLNEKNNRSYAFIIGLTLLSATLPCIGLAVLMLGKVFFELFDAAREKRALKYLGRTFSLTNVLSAAILVPIVGSYLLSNSAFQNTASASPADDSVTLSPLMLAAVFVLLAVAVAVFFMRRRLAETLGSDSYRLFWTASAALLLVMGVMILLHPETRKGYFVFLLLECGLYWLLLAGDFHRDRMFYLIALVFVVSPLIRVGIGADFCMRASVPALAVLMGYCAKKLVAVQEKKAPLTRWQSLSAKLLLVLLCIGAITPLVEFARGFCHVISEGSLGLTVDEIQTLNQYHSSGGVYGNFVSQSYEESLFFRFFAA